MRKIIHIITGLNTGGAEMMLYKFLSISKHHNVVISLGKSTGTNIEEMISELGVNIYFAELKLQNLTNRQNNIIKTIKREKPDILQGWMYHGNIIAQIIGIFFNNIPVFWNVRHSLHDLKREKLVLRFIIGASTFLSKLASQIIYNSIISAKQHESIGYKSSKTIYIPNGFDQNVFTPQKRSDAKKVFKSKYDISENQIIIGHVARYHPMKGHKEFISAIKILVDKNFPVKGIMIGNSIDQNNAYLRGFIKRNRISNSLLLLGECKNTDELIAGFDILVSSSLWGEGFSNTIGEAMACGVPCVATDVGDSKKILKNLGKIVPPGDACSLAKACAEFIRMPSDEIRLLSIKLRNEIVENYSITKIVNRYDNLYDAATLLSEEYLNKDSF